MNGEPGLLLGAVLAGLMGSPHCVGMCGPFALACAGSSRGSMAWHVGRLSTYAILGALAGAFGSVLPGPGWLAAAVSAALIVWFAGILAGLLPEPRWTPPFLRHIATSTLGKERTTSRLLFGLANGLLPCGLVYAALGLAIAASDPLAGAGVMLAFGLGTVPVLVVFTAGVKRVALRDLRIRRVLALLVLLSGLFSIASRMGWTGSDHADVQHHGAVAPPHRSLEFRVAEPAADGGPLSIGSQPMPAPLSAAQGTPADCHSI